MKNLILKALLLICFITVTHLAKAQLIYAADQFRESEGYRWIEGCYYDTTGTKHTGYIAWQVFENMKTGKKFGGQDFIYYKADLSGEKIKLTSTDLRSFKILKDSFVVSNNKLYPKESFPFLQVAVDRDPLKLYRAFKWTIVNVRGSYMSSYNILEIQRIYYFGTNPNDVEYFNKKNYKEVLTKIMADKPKVLDKIYTDFFGKGFYNLLQYCADYDRLWANAKGDATEQ